MNLLRRPSNDAIKSATKNVTDAISASLSCSVSGHPTTASPVTSCVEIMVFNDGNVTTSISGLVNKVALMGALTEAILYLHELEKSQADAAHHAAVFAMVEKVSTPERTDN